MPFSARARELQSRTTTEDARAGRKRRARKTPTVRQRLHVAAATIDPCTPVALRAQEPRGLRAGQELDLRTAPAPLLAASRQKLEGLLRRGGLDPARAACLTCD